MSQSDEPIFGSDSFLDIIANMVGILIILMVVAGMRVSKAPVSESISKPASIPEQVVSVESPSRLPGILVMPGTVVTLVPSMVEDPIKPVSPSIAPPVIAKKSHLKPEVLAVVPPRNRNPTQSSKPEYFSTLPETPAQPVPQLSAELQQQLNELKARVGSLATKYVQGQETQQALVMQHEDLLTKLTQTQTALQQRSAALQQNTSQLQEYQNQLNAAQEQLLALERQVRVLEESPLTGNQLEHRITAVSQTVTGKEVHFQMMQNQIGVVPLEPLLEELKAKVREDVRWLAKYPRHQGEIGPIQGYSLQYVVERQSLSMADQLNFQPGMMRIEVSEWRLLPEPTLTWETVQEAAKPGSRFHNTLGALPPGTTLTFWVYPDSFAAFRQIQAYAHARGFQVAGRPLPEGMPISGSPNGSESAGQ